jgi:hypothetical protein
MNKYFLAGYNEAVSGLQKQAQGEDFRGLHIGGYKAQDPVHGLGGVGFVPSAPSGIDPSVLAALIGGGAGLVGGGLTGDWRKALGLAALGGLGGYGGAEYGPELLEMLKAKPGGAGQPGK